MDSLSRYIIKLDSYLIIQMQIPGNKSTFLFPFPYSFQTVWWKIFHIFIKMFCKIFHIYMNKCFVTSKFQEIKHEINILLYSIATLRIQILKTCFCWLSSLSYCTMFVKLYIHVCKMSSVFKWIPSCHIYNHCWKSSLIFLFLCRDGGIFIFTRFYHVFLILRRLLFLFFWLTIVKTGVTWFSKFWRQ